MEHRQESRIGANRTNSYFGLLVDWLRKLVPDLRLIPGMIHDDGVPHLMTTGELSMKRLWKRALADAVVASHVREVSLRSACAGAGDVARSVDRFAARWIGPPIQSK